MDIRIVKITAVVLVLVLAGSFTSCGKKAEVCGEVPYKSCPCEEEKPLWSENLIIGEAYLFMDITPEQKNEQIYYPEKTKIVYCFYLDRNMYSRLFLYK